MKKRAVPLFLAVLTACALACPALAAEAPSPEATPSVLYPVEVLEYTEGDRAEPRISKTYELSPMDDPALIPTGDFERSGCLYTLLDIVKEDQTETDSKYYTETVTLDSKSKDMEEIMPLLAATCEAVTEDGYTGLLTLDTASIQVEASGYATSTRNVSATRSYPNLSEADVSLVPKSIEDSGRPHPGGCSMAGGRGLLQRRRHLYRHRFQQIRHRLHRHGGLRRRSDQDYQRDRALYRRFRPGRGAGGRNRYPTACRGGRRL